MCVCVRLKSKFGKSYNDALLLLRGTLESLKFLRKIRNLGTLYKFAALGMFAN